MATLVRPWYYRPIPSDATEVTHKGKPAVRFKGRDGKPVVGYLTKSRPNQCRVQSKTWYGQYRDADGKRQRVPLETANKEAARRILDQLMDREADRRAGRADPFEAHARTPLADHLTDWERALRATGATKKHVRQTVACARRVIDGCGFVFASEVAPAPVQVFVGGLRESRPPVEVPAQEWFTRKEIARLLGLSLASVSSHVIRHQLAAEGNGKARRYPRATVQTLAARQAEGISIKTANEYLAAIRALSRWLVDNKRMAADALDGLAGGNPELDRRRERRFLSADEVRRLIRAVAGSSWRFRGLTGPDRAILYALAVYTGYRATELASLTPDCFRLDSPTPSASLPPALTKNRKGAAQALPSDLADALRTYLHGRAAGEAVWPGNWADNAADMMRGDLDAAGIPFEVPGTGGKPLAADFHALRHTCGVLAEQGGASLREVMALMRHSDPKLTMRIYGRLQLHDLAETVGAMPRIVPGPDGAANLTPNLTPDLAPAGDGSSGRLMVGDGTVLPGPSAESLNPSGFDGERGAEMASEGSSPSRTRTYNKPVNSRLLYH
jgi:integrase